MEATIRTNNSNAFYSLIQFLKTLHFEVETKEKVLSKKKLTDYKKSILSVSVWSDKDIELLENNLKSFNAWKIEKW